MRVPVQLKREDGETRVFIDGDDVTDAVVQIGVQWDQERGAQAIVQLAANVELDLPASVENRSPVLVEEFLAGVPIDALRRAADEGDFATHPADKVMAELKQRAK